MTIHTTADADHQAANRADVNAALASAAAHVTVCDRCELPTDNAPEDGDLLCDACSPDAYHARVAALKAAVDDAAADVYEVRVHGVPGYPGYDEELAEAQRDLADAEAALLEAE
jgi:hypothetical protein